MQAVTRVDLHCHTTFSDGALSPEQLAERLAAGGVAFAALTDHDTVEGLARFAQAAARAGIGVIAGLELTVCCDGREAHLLAYGFDPGHAQLRATLRSVQQARDPGIHSIAHSMRKTGPGSGEPAGAPSEISVAPQGRLEIGDAIALVHRAGGLAFLAHPLVFEADPVRLRELLVRLKEQGLDGLEALYGPFPREARDRLCVMAGELGLLISAGTDQHEARSAGPDGWGIAMPTALWKQLRDALRSPGAGRGDAFEVERPQSYRPKRRQFVFHVACPSLLAIGLFVGAIYAVFLPTLERSLMDRKREMIRELTNSAWSLLAEAQKQEQAGLLTEPQAQALAKSRIESLRYGRERKDYFWLQDMHPRMLMHPYRKDLNDQDVSEFRDTRGVRLFVEMADLVRRRQEGYIEYVWQWKDDPGRMVAKESYIRGFEPWGWIIGTGIYVEDVKQEIARIEQNLVRASLVISALVAVLLLYVIRESLRLERERSRAEESRHELMERYRLLVEAATEGTLLVLEHRCRYANPVLLQMLGYSQAELEMLDLADLIPPQEGNQAVWDRVNRLLAGSEAAGGLEGTLRRRDGSALECVLALSPFDFAGKSGLILLAKDVGLRPGGAAVEEAGLQQLGQVARAAPAGLLRARAARRGVILQANDAAWAVLRLLRGEEAGAPALADFFVSAAEYDEFLHQLQQDGAAARQLHLSARDARTRVVSLRVVLAKDEGGQPHFIDGIVEDITPAARREAEREALVEKLQTSLLFLHEPVEQIGRSVVFCRPETPVQRVAGLMTEHGSSAVLVQAESGDVLGIVTDHDLRERVLAAGADMRLPASRIMTAPLVTISGRAQVYEAMLAMQEKGVQHLLVEDDGGRIVGILHSRDLLQLPAQGAVAIVREIARAARPDEVARCCQQTAGLVKSLLDCGAHPRNITRMVASVWDAATERLVALAMEELGPAPARFAFLVLGSQGRQEQTLFSDQDSAIVYEIDDETVEAEAVCRYFVELGSRVCRWLDEAGHPFCRGQVMASNPKWCQPLSVWKEYFAGWIARAEPQELLEFSIFFDFRAIRGEADLARQLRRYVQDVLRESQAFFPHFAQNSLLFKPPMRLFGRILGSSGEHAGSINLKDAMMPIVNFARLYTLRHAIDETHTLDRLDALARQDVLSESSREEVVAAYDFLMRLRLRHQVAASRAGQPLDNAINHRKLGQTEQALLRQAFAQIEAVQKKIRYDFLGGT